MDHAVCGCLCYYVLSWINDGSQLKEEGRIERNTTNETVRKGSTDSL